MIPITHEELLAYSMGVQGNFCVKVIYPGNIVYSIMLSPSVKADIAYANAKESLHDNRNWSNHLCS